MTDSDQAAKQESARRADVTGRRGLTTAEVAEILGVKRQTVYAYVSRGILHRQMAMDGRTSVFDRSEVEELRLGRRPEQEGVMRTMLTTGLTRVSDDGLWIRGRDVNAMVTAGAGFLDIVDLLWDSPDQESWTPAPEPQLPPEPRTPELLPPEPRTSESLQPHLQLPPNMKLLDQLRVLVAIESSRDPLRHDLSQKSVGQPAAAPSPPCAPRSATGAVSGPWTRHPSARCCGVV